MSTVTSLVTSIVVAGASAVASATPEEAIRTLEDAFVRKDIEAAVAAKDFETEAKLMLESINPELVSAEIVKQTAEVLELGFRKQIESDGFPDFTGLKCTLAKPSQVAENLVKVVETCTRTSGATSTQNLHAFKSATGWRVVVVGE